MKVVKTENDTLIIARKNGTEVRVVKTPSGIAVHDSETGAATLHTGISKDEAADIVRKIIETCQKAEIRDAERREA
jgi:mannitol/fructose-specific phosphotransferase system IIA component